MNELIKNELDKQQELIINDDHKYLYVSACPGAGKTYTLVKMINKRIDTLKDYQGIIACSFTKEASKEIKKRLLKENEKIENCYIETLDSFVLNIIIRPFLNRYLFYTNQITDRIDIKKIEIDNKKELNVYTRLYYESESVRQEADKYIIEWFENLKQGIYKISFPTYLLAKRIVEFNLFNNYFAMRFPAIYIDEAQDLNVFQHELIKALKQKTDINITFLGDPNQSIYQFRGAKPELFENLYKLGYHKKEITVSLRCHPSILYYANILQGKSVNKTFLESTVKLIENLDINFLESIGDKIFILVETNKKAAELYEKYKNNFDILYSRRMDNMPDDYEINCNILDELIKYYINYDNENDRYKYPAEELIKNLRMVSTKIKEQDFYIKNIDFNTFMKYALEKLNINVSDDTIRIIDEKLGIDMYRYYYYIADKNNKIMTIHTSKGLENDNVIICLNSQLKLDKEFKNKLFVAITRAKKNVYIYCPPNSNVKSYISNILNN